jgi:uncharacterized membrane protein YdjX (TVP38/TMEM64 family)
MSPVEAGDPASPAAASGRRPSWTRFAPLVLVLGGLALVYALGWHRFFTLDYLAASRDMLAGLVESHPVLSRAGFFAAYAAAVAVAFPAASVLTIVAGFLFGWLQGGLLVAFAATIGATALFLAARSAFGDALLKRVKGPARSLADGFSRDAFSYLLFLRLAPVFPFVVINIVPALFSVRLSTFLTATFLGILPGTFAYAFLGMGVGSALDAAKAAGETLSAGDLVTRELVLAFFALAAAALLPVVIKRLKPGLK